MSLDDLISLLIVAFVALSFLGRALRGARRPNRGQPPGSQRPRQPTQPNATTTTSAAPTSQGDADVSSAFEKRLEEARRRVLEADAQQPKTSRPLSRNRQVAEGATQKRPESVGSESARGRFQSPSSLEGVYTFLPSEEASAQPGLKVSKPLQVKRRRASKQATLGTGRLSFKEEDLLRGFIWQQILNEPRALRPHGRELSRRP